MAQVSIEFDLGLPNEYQVDHSQSDGNTRRFTYHGPDRIWLQLGADGTEKYGPLTEEDIMDGRPVPEDVVEWYEVDCSTNPLICQLRGPVVDERQEDYDETPGIHPGSPEITGYERLEVWGPPKPEDIYDKFSVTKNAEGGLDVRKLSVNESIHGDELNLTWDDIRTRRDKMLDQSDSNLPADAPQSLVDEWTAYRQRLRNMPTALSAVDPNVAAYMFPTQPSAATKYAAAEAAAEE